jgi:trigger factor
MRKLKVVTGLLTGIVAATMLAGCGNSTEDDFENYAKCAEVGNYVGVEYVPASREVSEDDIQSSIESFQNDNSETQENYDDKVASGDSVNISYVETISGSETDSNDSYDITLGNDTLGPDFDSQLEGYRPGSELTVIVNYPDDYSDTTVAGLSAEFDVTINYIEETIVPDYTDDLVNTATSGEYTTTEEYTAYLTEQLQESADSSADDSDKQSVLEAIEADTNFIQYPEDEIEAYITNVMDSINSQCSSYGIDFETYVTYFYGYSTEADFLSFLKDTVESVMKEKIVVCSIALKENLIATDDEVTAYKSKTAEENGIEVDEVSNYYSDEDLIFYATEEKVLDYILENAVQVESVEDDTEESTDDTDDEVTEEVATEEEE